jgi:hypothetical protein
MKSVSIRSKLTSLLLCGFSLCVVAAPATADTTTVFSDRVTWSAAAGAGVQNLDFAPLNPNGAYTSGCSSICGYTELGTGPVTLSWLQVFGSATMGSYRLRRHATGSCAGEAIRKMWSMASQHMGQVCA